MEQRPVLIATRVLCVFVGATALLLSCFPGPLGPRDYMIAGVVGTLAGMAVVFLSFAPGLGLVRRKTAVTKPDEPPPADTLPSSAADPHN